MTGPGARDGEIEAFVVDRYLETLLAREPGDARDVAADVRSTADRLVRDLPRFHPSFRFVDDLAARLATPARGPPGETGAQLGVPPILPRDDRMAWRRGHPPAGPMSRAVRAVARARTV